MKYILFLAFIFALIYLLKWRAVQKAADKARLEKEKQEAILAKQRFQQETEKMDR